MYICKFVYMYFCGVCYFKKTEPRLRRRDRRPVCEKQEKKPVYYFHGHQWLRATRSMLNRLSLVMASVLPESEKASSHIIPFLTVFMIWCTSRH